MTELEEDIKQRLEELRALKRRRRRRRNITIGLIISGLFITVSVVVFLFAKREYTQNFSKATDEIISIEDAKLDPSNTILGVWNYLTDNPSTKESNKYLSKALVKDYVNRQNTEPYSVLKGVGMYDDYNFENNQIIFLYKDYWYYFDLYYNGKGTKIYEIEFVKKASRESYVPYIIEGL